MKFITKHYSMQRDDLPARYDKFKCALCGEEFYMGPTEFFIKSPSIHWKYEDSDCIGVIEMVESVGSKGITPGEAPSLAMSGELLEGTNGMKEHRRKAQATKQAIKYIFTDTNNDREKMRERRDEVNKNSKGDLVGGKI